MASRLIIEMRFMEKKIGQRWIFDNTNGICSKHIRNGFVVEIISLNDLMMSNCVVVQSNYSLSSHFIPGHKILDILGSCDYHCWQYLSGQDRPKS